MDCYDRSGKPISFEAWVRLAEDRNYSRIARDEIGPYAISTVWLGIDHNFSRLGPPLIFETMIFLEATAVEAAPHGYPVWGEGECVRYASEEEALRGHARMLEMAGAALLVDQAALEAELAALEASLETAEGAPADEGGGAGDQESRASSSGEE